LNIATEVTFVYYQHQKLTLKLNIMQKTRKIIAIIFWVFTVIFALLELLFVWGAFESGEFASKILGTYIIIFFTLAVTMSLISSVIKK